MSEHEKAVSNANSPAPAVPEGWKLVPVEPTPEMLRVLPTVRGESVERELYAALLAAAPQAPAPAQRAAPSTCPHDGQCHPGFCPCKESGNG